MPVVTSTVRVKVDAATAFAVSQSTGEVRLRWDPFIRGQSFIDGAERPAKGVRTLTQHRLGWKMISEYVSFSPPTNVGMRMLEGPWFFDNFAGGWRFTPLAPPVDPAVADSDATAADAPAATDAVWRYSFRCRPRWLAPLAERIGVWFLQRDVDRRIAGFAAACNDPWIIAAVQPHIPSPTPPTHDGHEGQDLDPAVDDGA